MSSNPSIWPNLLLEIMYLRLQVQSERRAHRNNLPWLWSILAQPQHWLLSQIPLLMKRTFWGILQNSSLGTFRLLFQAVLSSIVVLMISTSSTMMLQRPLLILISLKWIRLLHKSSRSIQKMSRKRPIIQSATEFRIWITRLQHLSKLRLLLRFQSKILVMLPLV